MGMAASQARLLSITARLTDNEQTGQAVSFAKERLADKTQQVTEAYNNALSATKLQVMTGYADGAASFTDVSFSMLSSPQVLNLGKQYIVTDPKGKVLVEKDVAKAFEDANGNINMFLGALGYSVSDVNPTVKQDSHLALTGDDRTEMEAKQAEIEEAIHQAWDRYFVSIDKSKNYFVTDENEHAHHWSFDYRENSSTIGDGFALMSIFEEQVDSDGNIVTDANGEIQYNQLVDHMVINYEGSTQEQLDLYNRAVALTESYYSNGRTYNYTDENGVLQTEVCDAHDLSANDVKTNFNMENKSEIQYYQNLFHKMATSGYFSYTNSLLEVSEHVIYLNAQLTSGASTCTTDGSPLRDANIFEEYLKSGKLLLQSYSSTKKTFTSVSLAEDTCFQEVEDKTAIAAAEAKYNQDLQQIERLDTKYDMQLKRLDTEHNTLQTEYESVKKVLTKNVESSFKTFS